MGNLRSTADDRIPVPAEVYHQLRVDAERHRQRIDQQGRALLRELEGLNQRRDRLVAERAQLADLDARLAATVPV